MLPSDTRLYTWVDVEDFLLRLQRAKEWPDWLYQVRAYWSEIEISVKPGYNRKNVLNWVFDKFDPRFDMDSCEIILESTVASSRRLPVFISDNDEEIKPAKFVPSLARPAVITHTEEQWHPEPLANDLPPVIVFHSFKGGVGRTLHAVALS